MIDYRRYVNLYRILYCVRDEDRVGHVRAGGVRMMLIGGRILCAADFWNRNEEDNTMEGTE